MCGRYAPKGYAADTVPETWDKTQSRPPETQEELRAPDRYMTDPASVAGTVLSVMRASAFHLPARSGFHTKEKYKFSGGAGVASLDEAETGRRRRAKAGDDVPQKNRADVVRRTAVPQPGPPQEVKVVATAFATAPFDHASDGANRPGAVVHVKHFAFHRPARRIEGHTNIIKDHPGLRKPFPLGPAGLWYHRRGQRHNHGFQRLLQGVGR